jgi:hypothetical protein
VKADGKPSNWLAQNFGVYKKQEGNGKVGLSFHWLAVGQKLLSSYMTTERTKTRKEQEFQMALKRGSFAGLGKTAAGLC